MPKYYDFKVAGYYLYFTSFCVVECMHVLNDREIAKISEFIKDHYQEMYIRWTQYSKKGYFEK